MRAAVVTLGKKHSLRLVNVDMPKVGDDDVLVKVDRVGVCGTDEDIYHGRYGEAPEGKDVLIIGHEGIGEVVETGKECRCLSSGDIVVSTIRRPCWEHCFNCRNGQPDYCLTGDYKERGIRGLDGYMAEYYVEKPLNMVRLPKELKNVGVLLEPVSIVEKGINGIFRIQQRMLWHPTKALVLGAGPVGLLATFVLRKIGLETYTMATRDKQSLKARVAEESGAHYIDANVEPLETLPGRYGDFDIIIEATGSSKLAFGAMGMINKNGAVCLLGLYPGKNQEVICTNCIGMSLVLNNSVVFGSVSSNRLDFERGIDTLGEMEQKWPGLLEKMFTRCVSLDNVEDAMQHGRDDIKVVVKVS